MFQSRLYKTNMKKGKQLLAWANFPIAHFARSIDINSSYHQNSYNFSNSFNTKEPFISSHRHMNWKKVFSHMYMPMNMTGANLFCPTIYSRKQILAVLSTQMFTIKSPESIKPNTLLYLLLRNFLERLEGTREVI